MIISQSYKGYQLEYSPYGGITKIFDRGVAIKAFYGHGEKEGFKTAKKYINQNNFL